MMQLYFTPFDLILASWKLKNSLIHLSSIFRNKNVAPCSLVQTFDSWSILPNYYISYLVWYREVRIWSWKRVLLPYLLEVFLNSSVFFYYILNKFLGTIKFFMCSFYENISQTWIWYLFFCYLNFASRFHLQIPYCFTSFTYNKTNTFIWNWNN